jgi:NADPH-dependent 2,4-dienoyl-CoA reductase/sulfur reductase-like enzyme
VVDYLAGTGLVEDGAVPVDATLATRAPGVFAAGDIAAMEAGPGRPDRNRDRRPAGPQRIEHWVVAQRQGQHAARAMLGSKAAYDETPFFWTRQAGFSLKHIGSGEPFDEVAFRGDVDSGKFLAGFYRTGRLVAASTVGRANDLIAVERILRRGLPLSPAQFADAEFDLLTVARQGTR